MESVSSHFVPCEDPPSLPGSTRSPMALSVFSSPHPTLLSPNEAGDDGILETNSVTVVPNLTPVSTPLAKKGRRRGATAYSFGDEVSLLECVEEVLPSQNSDWDAVVQLYNTRYAAKFHRTFRSADGLKGRFREILWGESSGGGERTEMQTRAREIIKKIDEKNGTVRSDVPFKTSDKSEESASSANEKEHVERGKGGANARFRKQMLDAINVSNSIQSEALALDRKRTEETLFILKEMLKKF